VSAGREAGDRGGLSACKFARQDRVRRDGRRATDDGEASMRTGEGPRQARRVWLGRRGGTGTAGHEDRREGRRGGKRDKRGAGTGKGTRDKQGGTRTSEEARDGRGTRYEDERGGTRTSKGATGQTRGKDRQRRRHKDGRREARTGMGKGRQGAQRQRARRHKDRQGDTRTGKESKRTGRRNKDRHGQRQAGGTRTESKEAQGRAGGTRTGKESKRTGRRHKDSKERKDNEQGGRRTRSEEARGQAATRQEDNGGTRTASERPARRAWEPQARRTEQQGCGASGDLEHHKFARQDQAASFPREATATGAVVEWQTGQTPRRKIERGVGSGHGHGPWWGENMRRGEGSGVDLESIARLGREEVGDLVAVHVEGKLVHPKSKASVPLAVQHPIEGMV